MTVWLLGEPPSWRLKGVVQERIYKHKGRPITQNGLPDDEVVLEREYKASSELGVEESMPESRQRWVKFMSTLVTLTVSEVKKTCR